MEEKIAEKSGIAAVMLWIGALIFPIFGILAWSRRMEGWRWFLALSVLFFFVMLFCAIHEARRPKVVIRRVGENLLVFTKGRWKTVAMTEIETVDFRETESGNIRMRCGTLKIVTASGTIRIYNVKNVKRVAMKLWQGDHPTFSIMK